MTKKNNNLLNLLPVDLINTISQYTCESYKLDKKHRVKTIKYKCLMCKNFVYKRSFSKYYYSCKKCSKHFSNVSPDYSKIMNEINYYRQIDENEYKLRQYHKIEFEKSTYTDFNRFLYFKERQYNLQERLGYMLIKRIEEKDKIYCIINNINRYEKINEERRRVRNIMRNWVFDSGRRDCNARVLYECNNHIISCPNIDRHYQYNKDYKLIKY